MDGRVDEDGSRGDKPGLVSRLLAKGSPHHRRIPYLRALPLPALAIVLLVAFVNLLIWAAVGVVLHFHPNLVTTAVLSYTLGLRHALDADHISAIDVTTRRLLASGRRSVTVGTFFSLGHSTIVIITCLVVASTAAAVTSRFGAFSTTGGIIGSTVSAVFLIVLGAMNLFILLRLLAELRFYSRSPPGAVFPGAADDADPFAAGRGPLARVLRTVFRLIDRPWKMYPLGVLFGLGFDTSSEIALLGISAVESAHHTSIWLILIFPILFTAGMCLLDTLDGAAMSALYSSARLANDRVAVAYYQAVLTGITVFVAVVIGTFQVLTMIDSVAEPEGRFWDGVNVLGDHYDIIGGVICGCFVVFGGLATVLYKPWRRRLDARRAKLAALEDDEEFPADGELGSVEQVDTQRVPVERDAKSTPKDGFAVQVYHDEAHAGPSAA